MQEVGIFALKYTIISQLLDSEELAFTVTEEGGNHKLLVEGLKDYKKEVQPPLEYFKSVEFDPESWSCTSDLSTLIPIIKTSLGGDNMYSLLFACYSILTYEFQLFRGIPQLWIQAPNEINRLNITNLIGALFFNVIPIPSRQSIEGISYLIENFSPTLVIVLNSTGISTQLHTLLNQPIQKVTAYYDKTGNTNSTYCPRVIISPYRPSNAILEHTILLEVFNTTQPVNLKNEMNLDFIKYALSVQDQVKVDDKALLADCFIPMQKIGKTFLKMGLINQELWEKYQSLVTDKVNYRNGFYPELEIFEAIREYLKEESRYELHPLCDMAAFVKNRTDIPNTQVLSRFLNKYGLIINTKRDRVPLNYTKVPAEDREKKHQRTCVKIDEKRLEHLYKRYK